jgi:hypothetical protein
VLPFRFGERCDFITLSQVDAIPHPNPLPEWEGDTYRLYRARLTV